MNVETIELTAVAEAAKTEEKNDIELLSVTDLDLVGGGAFVGAFN